MKYQFIPIKWGNLICEHCPGKFDLWQFALHIITAQAVAVGCVWCSWWLFSTFQCRIASLWIIWLCGYRDMDRIDIGIKCGISIGIDIKKSVTICSPTRYNPASVNSLAILDAPTPYCGGSNYCRVVPSTYKHTLECQIEGQACLFIFHFLPTWPKPIWPYPFIFSGFIWQPVLCLSLTSQLKPWNVWMLTILPAIYGPFVIWFLYIWQSLFTYCMMKTNFYWKLLFLQVD